MARVRKVELTSEKLKRRLHQQKNKLQNLLMNLSLLDYRRKIL